MGYCRTIQHYVGTKSEKMRSMIDEVIRQRKIKDLSNIIKNKELRQTIHQYHKTKKVFDVVKKKLEVVEKRLGIEFHSGSWMDDDDEIKIKHITVARSCHIPIADFKQLQLADNLFALGNKKQADEIWNSLITKYELDKGIEING